MQLSLRHLLRLVRSARTAARSAICQQLPLMASPVHGLRLHSIHTATTTYTFTPAAGQCATTATLTITVNASITPTFAAVAPICPGAALAPLPTTSINGITGTWAPALNNTATTTYTFTPAAGQCATTATLTITVNCKYDTDIRCRSSDLFWCSSCSTANHFH